MLSPDDHVSAEQTRAHLTETLRCEHAEANARLTEALAEEQRATDRLSRIERDYTDGGLPAADYVRMSARLTEELAAARAQREQAERHASNLDATAGEIGDAVLSALGGVHEAIAAFLADARHIDEVRLRLRQVFEHFVAEDDGDGGIALVPRMRPEALDVVMADIADARREGMRIQPMHWATPTR